MATQSKDFGINIGNIINQAVDMLIEAKLNKANFDATYEAVVIEVPSATTGFYKVKIQNAIVEALSTGGTYYKGETVYVNVPRNDPNQLKFIIGRKPKAGDTQNLKAFDFKYPFDYFVPLTDLLNSSYTVFSKTSGGYLANYPLHGEKRKIPTPVRTDPNCIWYWTWGNQADNDLRSIGETIGVLADWTTYLAEYQPMAGDYGLRFVVNGIIINDEEREINHTENYYFNTREMYGNPYAFYEPETQLILFDVSKFKLIKSIEAYFWQDHKFVDINNKPIPFENSLNSEENPDNNNGLLPSNILFNNLKILYGMHVNNMENENVFITTYDSRIFGTEPLSDKARAELDKRTLNMSWVHKNEKVKNSDEDTYSVINSAGSLDIFNLGREDADKAHIYWYRETPFKEKDTSAPSLDKYGDKVNYAGVNYRYLPGHDDQTSLDDKTSIDVVLDIELAKESFKVVIEYNNTYAVSEALTFYNENRDIESNLNAALNGIIFKLFRSVNTHDANTGRVKVLTDSLGKVITDTEGNAIPIQTIINDDTVGNFFVYDENNKVLRNDDDVYFSNVDYFIQVWIYSEDQSTPEHPVYVPLTNDVCGAEDIKWSYPSLDTMIASFSAITATELGKYREIFAQGSLASDSNTMAITRKFRIRDYWDLRATDNAIMVTIKRNGRYYSCTKELLFGQAGSTGSQYTIVADVAGIINGARDSCIHKGTGNFKITARLYDLKGNLFNANDYPVIFNFELLNKNVCTITNTVFSDLEGFTNNVLTAVLNSDYPPIYKISCDIDKENIVSTDETFRMSYSIYTIIGCSSLVGTVSDDSGLLKSCGYVGCPNRIEYKSDGTTPIYNLGDFIVRTHSKGSVGDPNYEHREYLYPSWSLIQFLNGTRINDSSKIKYVKLKSLTHKNQDINSNIDAANKTLIDKSATKEYTTYSLSTAVVQGKKGFYWEDAMMYDTSTYLECQLPWGGTFYQAIAFAHNVYPSSLLNSWNGQLVIDKEKNAILTRMLSAGVKDSENRFSGVLLGDWSEYGDDSIDPIGLYGFAHGILTYGFKVDGTGFIGAAGDGLITFDGNHALISDYTHDHYINLNPLKYTYNSSQGSIDINSGTYSQYFLYAKNQKIVENNDDILSIHRDDYGRISVPWIKKFLDDTLSDYFVVDPNNGVYMSGGIVARYGVIGNCLQLSEAGLTYKKNNGIMFIGQERRRNAKLVPEDSNNINYDTYFWASAKYNEDSWNNSEFDYIDSENGVSGDTVGRYIFWAGSTNDNGIPLSYPNFGIEHNGVVHLTGAYISGAIKATSLEILMPDGTYHSSKEKLHATYYMSTNPACLTTAGGICSHTYGDLLFDGDIWYDTSTSVNLESITTYSVAYANATDNNPGSLPTEAPASHSNNGDAANALTSSSTTIAPTATTGYKVLTWKKPNDGATITVDWHENNGTMLPPTGWTLLPTLAADTLTFMNTYTDNLEESLVSILSALVDSINESYNSIRRGMTPLAFYSGKCFTSLSASTVTAPSELNIGTVPPGLAIYQLKDDGNGNYVYTGSSFLLNGERMGFFKEFKDKNENITTTLPLLAYYNGNMALAGNLLFGLDVTAATDTNGFNTDQPNFYQNVLEGLKCTLSLGNGAIVLNGGHTAGGNGVTAATGIPFLKVGKDIGAKVLIGADSNDDVDVLIGAYRGKATIKLAGFDIKGVSGNNIIEYGAPSPSTSEIATSHTFTYYTYDPENTDSTVGTSTSSVAINYLKDTFTLNPAQYTYEDLRQFSVTRGTTGFLLLENTPDDEPGSSGTITNTGFATIFAPVTPSTSYTSILNGWDIIQGGNGYFTGNISASTIYANAIYLNDAVLATQKWVAESVGSVVSTLLTLITNALNKANNAYYKANHHSHS